MQYGSVDALPTPFPFLSLMSMSHRWGLNTLALILFFFRLCRRDDCCRWCAVRAEADGVDGCNLPPVDSGKR